MLIGEVRSIDLDAKVVELDVEGRSKRLRASFRPSLDRAVCRAVGGPVKVLGHRDRWGELWLDEIRLLGFGGSSAQAPAPSGAGTSSRDKPRSGLSHAEIMLMLAEIEAERRREAAEATDDQVPVTEKC